MVLFAECEHLLLQLLNARSIEGKLSDLRVKFFARLKVAVERAVFIKDRTNLSPARDVFSSSQFIHFLVMLPLFLGHVGEVSLTSLLAEPPLRICLSFARERSGRRWIALRLQSQSCFS